MAVFLSVFPHESTIVAVIREESGNGSLHPARSRLNPFNTPQPLDRRHCPNPPHPHGSLPRIRCQRLITGVVETVARQSFNRDATPIARLTAPQSSSPRCTLSFGEARSANYGGKRSRYERAPFGDTAWRRRLEGMSERHK